MRSLSEKILDVSKIESRTLRLDKERFNINEKIRNILNDIKSKENDIEIIFSEPNVDAIIVEADRVRIDEVISNLLINAVKFTKRNSRVNGGVDDHNLSAITIFTSIKSNQKYNKDNMNGKRGGEVVITLRIRGTGIDPAIKDKLFSIFVTNPTGSGLGLFISKGIVETHGENILDKKNADGNRRPLIL